MTPSLAHLQPTRRIWPRSSDVSRNPVPANRGSDVSRNPNQAISRSDVSRDPDQVRTKAKMVATHVAPTVEKNGTGIGTCMSDVSRDSDRGRATAMVATCVAPTIEKNGTGIGTCRSDVSRDPVAARTSA
jgi:hypothetical protein